MSRLAPIPDTKCARPTCQRRVGEAQWRQGVRLCVQCRALATGDLFKPKPLGPRQPDGGRRAGRLEVVRPVKPSRPKLDSVDPPVLGDPAKPFAVAATDAQLAELDRARVASDPRTLRLRELREQGYPLARAIEIIESENPSTEGEPHEA